MKKMSDYQKKFAYQPVELSAEVLANIERLRVKLGMPAKRDRVVFEGGARWLTTV
jgi:hypothetical protein